SYPVSGARTAVGRAGERALDGRSAGGIMRVGTRAQNGRMSRVGNECVRSPTNARFALLTRAILTMRAAPCRLRLARSNARVATAHSGAPAPREIQEIPLRQTTKYAAVFAAAALALSACGSGDTTDGSGGTATGTETGNGTSEQTSDVKVGMAYDVG